MPAVDTNIQQTEQIYAIPQWGEGYFLVNERGHLCVRPDPQRDVTVDLCQAAEEIHRVSAAWPVLVRFVDILRDRVRSMRQAFDRARATMGFRGGFTPIYPIKVNQQRSVVEEILADGATGLEAGSKPELMVALALLPPDGILICNGYKDREYIRLALIGQRLGLRLFIVIEKPSEVDLVFEESEKLGITPRLGIRVRLMASASGNWQNSGGEKAKFGLSAGQILALVRRLEEMGKLNTLVLLHAHLGSQIPNLQDIRKGLQELAQYFAELLDLGAPIGTVDVGGGQGVDYEGTRTRQYCSVNYGLQAYAEAVVGALAEICAARDLPQPNILTESGRAMTAHHAVLITNVIEMETTPGAGVAVSLDDSAHPLLRRLHESLTDVERRPPLETYQDARQLFDDARGLFERGALDLAQRASVEEQFYALCRALQDRLRPENRGHRETLEQVNMVLADKLFCNFSLFQSLPDVWAIEQIFPIVPLHRLDELPTRRAVIHDITCDSDGTIGLYVDQDGVEHSLPVHALKNGEPYLLGIFMLGAYQETLGDIHNLFGDTHAINLELDAEGGYHLLGLEKGDAVDELLAYVHFDPQAMLQYYRDRLGQAGIDRGTREHYYAELKAGLSGYTYLED